MKVAIGNDHGGLEYKNLLIEHLKALGHEVINVGTDTLDSCHYPIFAKKVADLVSLKEADLGVLVCTSGEGVCIAANKVKGVRCGIAYNDEVSHLMVEHNNANVIAFGQKFMEYQDVERRLDIFLNAKFMGGRHETRVNLITEIENK